MSAQQRIVDSLTDRYTVDRASDTIFSITALDGDVLAAPIALHLPEGLTQRYLDTLSRSVVEAGFADGVDYVKMLVDEDLQPALACGWTVRSLGVRRSRYLRRAQWYADMVKSAWRPSEERGPFEWRT